MIGAGDDAELVALSPGIRDIALSEEARGIAKILIILSRGGVIERGSGLFGIGAGTLKNFDDGFKGGIVIGPIGSHAGGGGMGDDETVARLDLLVQHFRV